MFWKSNRQSTHLVHIVIPSTNKTLASQVLKFQILIIYLDG